MTLALYLLPALLIVLVVGAAGILVTGMIRFFTLVLGTTAEWGYYGRRENGSPAHLVKKGSLPE